MSRFDWTCASERYSEQEVIQSPDPMSPEPVRQWPIFKVYLLGRTRPGKVLLIRELAVRIKVYQDET